MACGARHAHRASNWPTFVRLLGLLCHRVDARATAICTKPATEPSKRQWRPVAAIWDRVKLRNDPMR